MAPKSTTVEGATGRAAAAYAMAASVGMALWFWTSLTSGKREAWDDSAYWTFTYPAAIVVSALLGYFFPKRPWRWPLTVFLAQFIAMTIRNGEIGSLWPLGMIVFAVLAVPGVLLAKLASSMRARAA